MLQRISEDNSLHRTVLSSAVLWFMISCPFLSASGEVLPHDSVFNELPELEVKDSGHLPYIIGEDGGLEMKSREIRRLSRTLGEADYINQLKSMSGIDSPSDYSAGFSTLGSDYTQTLYLADGVPVTYPYRFGGIFSMFCPDYYKDMRLETSSSSAGIARLGPMLSFSSGERFRTGVEGAASVGLMASSITLRGGVAGKVSVAASGRISYVDQVYGKWLNHRDYGLAFSFGDLNAAVAWKINGHDRLKATYFQSVDRVGYDDRNYSLDTRMHWKNRHYSLSFSHSGDLFYDLTLYSTAFSNTLSLRIPQFKLRGPSSLDSYGGRMTMGHKPDQGIVEEWETGFLAEAHKVAPQSAEMIMTEEGEERSSESVIQRLLTLSGYGKIKLLFADRIGLSAESGVGFYESDTSGKRFKRFYVSPRLRLSYMLDSGEISVFMGISAQPLHQVGFSELGLASDFWVGACSGVPVQGAFALGVSFTKELPFHGLSVSGDIFWKRLRNQAEYRGVVLDVVDEDYDPFRHLIIADGYNYGFGVVLRKKSGSVTGEAGYSYSGGKRWLPSVKTEKWEPLNGTGHSIKGRVDWHINGHWLATASIRVSSGRRYTPVKVLYAVGNNVVMEYGKRNSARLPSYQRLDLSCTYTFSTGSRIPLRHLVNFSLLNAYGHKNVEMQYFILDSGKGRYSLKRLYSLYRFLPSLSYSIEF